MVRHDFRVGPRAAIVLEDVEPLAKALATPRSDHSTRAIEPGFVRFVKAPRDLAERPLDGELQLGGDPAWIQEPVAMTCAGCAKEMVFVFRLAAPNDFEECPEPAGGSGAVYFFACPDAKCARFSSVAQWS
jgi:hypothetical protein